MNDPWLMWMIGLVMGVALAAVASILLVKTKLPTLQRVASGGKKLVPLMVVAIVMVVLFAPSAVTLAQTPVPIIIDTNEIFTQTNNWIQQFTPIQAIGIGASLALAILGFLAAVLTGAFKGAR